MKLTRWILVAAVLCAVAMEGETVRAQDGSRSFAMGMTYWPSTGALGSDKLLRKDLGLLLRNTEVIHVQVPWCPGKELFQAGWMSSVARETSKQLAVSVDWLAPSRQAVRCAQNSPWRFADSSTAESFERAVAKLVHRVRPEYLVLGVEVDHYAVANPQDFREFLTIYSRTRSRIEEVSPHTRVGVSLQYEHALAVVGSSSSLLEDLVTAFQGMSDFIGLSVYPFKAGMDPESIDVEYFEPVSDRSLPVIVTETAWPGKAASQQCYLKRILVAANDLEAELLIWTSTRDVEGSALGPGVPSWADQLGLWDALGTPKPGLRVWRTWLAKSRAAD